MPFSLVAGLAYDALGEKRRGYQNFEGTTLGVKGALRRDERNDVDSFDQYLQASLQMTPRWSANAGVRHSRVGFESEDRYIVGTNPDDSGSVSYSATLPVLGVMFAASDSIHLYVTAGRGFETPTLNELAYRPSGETGLNLALQAARSKSLEVGAKFRFAPAGRGDLRGVRDPHHRRDRDPDQRRRPVDLPERRRDAAPRHRAVGHGRSRQRPAPAGRLHLARRALSRPVPDLRRRRPAPPRR